MLLRGSGVLALYNGLLCLLWVLVVGIALNPQPVSELASLLSGNQFRQAMILLAWNCRGLAQVESKRSLKAIVNKVCPDFLFLSKVKISSNRVKSLYFIHWVSIS